MIDWATLRPGLLSLVQQMTGLDQGAWFDETRPHVTEAIVLLTHTATKTIGQLPDSVFAPADPDHPEDPWFQTTTSGKTITVRVRVDTFKGDTADVYLDRMRDRLFQLSYMLAFRTIGCGVATFTPFVDLTPTKDNRRRASGACDLLLNLGSSDTDPTEYEIIETLDNPELLQP